MLPDDQSLFPVNPVVKRVTGFQPVKTRPGLPLPSGIPQENIAEWDGSATIKAGIMNL
jgi:hypothetical protein